jgi:hypothetical protein
VITVTDVFPVSDNLHVMPSSEKMEGQMRKLVTFAIAAAMTSLFALIFWQFGMNATDAAGPRSKPDYAVTSAPYLPIQRLEPVY